MAIIVDQIINGDFGSIRDVIHNENLNLTLMETHCGYQFIIDSNKIILFENITKRTKIILNTFNNDTILFYYKSKIYCTNVEKFLNLSFGLWGNFETYTKCLYSIDFIYDTYFSCGLFILSTAKKILFIDSFDGLFICDLLSGNLELRFFPHQIMQSDNTWHFGEIGEITISTDENYFYFLEYGEGKIMRVIRVNDFKQIYSEACCYAIGDRGFFIKITLFFLQVAIGTAMLIFKR